MKVDALELKLDAAKIYSVKLEGEVSKLSHARDAKGGEFEHLSKVGWGKCTQAV